jgi:hypothetical protein
MRGLWNNGGENLCWMNTSLQSLMSLEPFVWAVLRESDSAHGSVFREALRDVFLFYKFGREGNIKANTMRTICGEAAMSKP